MVYEFKNTDKHVFNGELKKQFEDYIEYLRINEKHPNKLIYIFRESSEGSADMLIQMTNYANKIFEKEELGLIFDPEASVIFLKEKDKGSIHLTNYEQNERN